MTMTRRFLMFFVFALVSVAMPARAEEYVKPNAENILDTLVRFGAIDLSNDTLLDAYAQILACDLFKDFYKDEFKWQKARPVIREQVRKSVSTFPTGFRYETVLQLGRYDFAKKVYPFVEKSQRIGINVFTVDRDINRVCQYGGKDNVAAILPKRFKIVLDKPFNIIDLPLAPSEGKALAERMDRDGNKEHSIFARINLRIMFVAPIDFSKRSSEGTNFAVRTQVTQAGLDSESVVLDARLDSVEYFEDENFTRLIYRYRP